MAKCPGKYPNASGGLPLPCPPADLPLPKLRRRGMLDTGMHQSELLPDGYQLPPVRRRPSGPDMRGSDGWAPQRGYEGVP